MIVLIIAIVTLLVSVALAVLFFYKNLEQEQESSRIEWVDHDEVINHWLCYSSRGTYKEYKFHIWCRKNRGIWHVGVFGSEGFTIAQSIAWSRSEAKDECELAVEAIEYESR